MYQQIYVSAYAEIYNDFYLSEINIRLYQSARVFLLSLSFSRNINCNYPHAADPHIADCFAALPKLAFGLNVGKLNPSLPPLQPSVVDLSNTREIAVAFVHRLSFLSLSFPLLSLSLSLFSSRWSFNSN